LEKEHANTSNSLTQCRGITDNNQLDIEDLQFKFKSLNDFVRNSDQSSEPL